MKAIKKMINSACQWDVQARKRMDCGAAWTIGLVEARSRKPCGQSCRSGGP